jgi:disulfide oxidoreductase YuzD
VEGIDQIVSEKNTKKAADIRRSESDGVVRTYVKRQYSTSKYERKYIPRKNSKRQNIADSAVQTDQPSVSIYPALLVSTKPVSMATSHWWCIGAPE